MPRKKTDKTEEVDPAEAFEFEIDEDAFEVAPPQAPAKATSGGLDPGGAPRTISIEPGDTILVEVPAADGRWQKWSLTLNAALRPVIRVV